MSSDSSRESSGTERLDAAAVTALYQQLGDEIRAFLLGVLRDPDLAGECLQIVFQKTIEQGHLVRENPRGWLFRVAFHEAMLIRRKQGREKELLQTVAWRQRIQKPEPESSATSVLRQETVQEVQEALAELPAEQLQIVRMRIYEEKKFAVIAEELNLPLGTVLTRMRLAMQRLERRLRRTAPDR